MSSSRSALRSPPPAFPAAIPAAWPRAAHIALSLKGPDGDIVKNVSITTTAGQTIGNVVIGAEHRAWAARRRFTLNSRRLDLHRHQRALSRLSRSTSPATPPSAAPPASASAELVRPGRQRAGPAGRRASASPPPVANNPAQVGLGHAPASPPARWPATRSCRRATIPAPSRCRMSSTKPQSFQAAGGIAAQTASLSDYAATFYQNLSTQSNAVTTNQTTQDDRLTEANSRVASNSGVNLDEELTNLTTYQQAYTRGRAHPDGGGPALSDPAADPVRTSKGFGMSIDRVATAQQSAYFLSARSKQAGTALDTTQQQIASGENRHHLCRLRQPDPGADRHHVRQCAQRRLYHRHQLGHHPGPICRTPSSPACRAWRPSCRQAVSDAVANNDASTLMTQAQSIFDQAQRILNSKDANGDYIYGGGKTDTPPVTVSFAVAACRRCPRFPAPSPMAIYKKSVQVADGADVTYGVTASDVGTGLMQALQGHRRFRCRRHRQFHAATNLTPGPEQLSHRRDLGGQHGGQQSQQCHRRRMAMSLTSCRDAQTSRPR